MENQRVFVEIDGNNFYHRLKELDLKNLLSFDYQKLINFILNNRNGHLVSINYYIGAIHTKAGDLKSQQLWQAQRKLVGLLKKQGVKISFGNMLKTDDYHEKGVDVLIAVDMLTAAYENLCDKIILVSSDTDLLPAIDKARKLGKIVEYIGFSHKASHAMIDRCSSCFLLRKGDLEKFLNL